MKLSKLALFLMLVVAFASCKNDDESPTNCTQSDWVGTYDGTLNCNGASEDVTVTITASGSEAIVIKYETANLETEFDPLTPNGCNLDVSQSDQGITLSVNAELDGDNLTFSEDLTIGGGTSSCDITATRQ